MYIFHKDQILFRQKDRGTMKYAIDRYEMELEKEVSADIFYNKYIPRKKDRFVSVNAVNFLEDDVTLVPINFIPYPGKNFGMTIEPEGALDFTKSGLIMQMDLPMEGQFLHMEKQEEKRSGKAVIFHLINNIM